MRRPVLVGSAFLLALLLAGCGGDGLLLFPGQTGGEAAIRGPADGAIVAPGDPVPLRVDDASAADIEREMEIVVLSSTGQPVWRERTAAPAPGEALDFRFPDVPAGRYRLEITLFHDGEQVQRRVATLFAVRKVPRIVAISSFPPAIMPSSPVLLRAELDWPEATDPFLRWSWRDRTIARGSASEGTTEVLWRAPAEEGVYTVMLEVFPAAPQGGGDYAFRSSISMATDVYVSSAQQALRSELGPPACYWSLFRLQAELEDLGAGARALGSAKAIPIGTLRVVPSGDGFGYRLDGSAGFSVARCLLPIEDGALTPFTVTIGASVEAVGAEQRILTVQADGGLTFALGLDAAGSPVLSLGTDGSDPASIASGAAPVQPGRRFQLSLSVVPRQSGIETRWFVDGMPVSVVPVDLTIPRLLGTGTSRIAGEGGLAGIIDSIGVYYRDSAGRPAIDPDIFAAAARRSDGDRLLLAEGFDGLFLPASFELEGKAALGTGALLLGAGAAVRLPSMAVPTEGFSLVAALASASERTASLSVAWDGADEPFLETSIAAEAGALRLAFGGETISALTPGGSASWLFPAAPSEKADLVVRFAASPDAKGQLVIDSVLALKPKEKE